MGLHIIPYRIKGRDSGGYLITESVEIPGFDTARHSGDRDFVGQYEFFDTIRDESRYPDGHSYCRPKSQMLDWIKSSDLIEGNKNRLFDLMFFLEKNDDVWLFLSV